MPIKGLTDRKTPTFPKIGDIRKGAKKTQDDRPGKDLTYFRYAALEGEALAAAKFAEVYGDEPREINILLPFDEIDRNFDAFMERHTAGALQCRGDGETAFMWRDDDGKMQHTPKPCPSDGCEGCKETGRLKVIIPELRRLAFVTVHTTSIWDIQELTNNLRALKSMTGNGLRGIPLVLKRRPRKVSTPRAGGKRVRQEKWLLSIEADQSWVEAQLEAMRVQALPQLPGALNGEELEALEWEKTEEIDDIDIVTGEIIEIEEELEQEPKTDGEAVVDDTPFDSPEAAVKWALDQHAFLAKNQANDAYTKLKTEKKPEDAAEMGVLWREYIAHRIADLEAAEEG